MDLISKVIGSNPESFRLLVKTFPRYDLKVHLLRYAASVADKDGFWGEFGVYSGKTLHTLTEYYSPVYGFDSFKGLPEKWNDANPQGMFNLDGKRPFPPTDKMILVEGWFNESIPTLLKTTNIGTPKFLHLDADLYSSTKCVLDNLKPYFKDNCVMVFDEFCEYEGWEQHEYKALWEFLYEMKDELLDIEVIGYSNQNNSYLSFAIKLMFKNKKQ